MTALRLAGAGAGVMAILASLGGAGGAAAVAADTLGRVLAVDAGAVLTARGDGSVLVTAPPGAVVLALSSGDVRVMATTTELVGQGDAAGLVVVYSGLAQATGATVIAAGSALGAVPTSGQIEVTAFVDGAVVDLAPRLADDTAPSRTDPTTGSGSMLRPVAGAVISQGFGCTAFAAEPADSSCPGGHYHSGVDLAAPLGTPVRAVLGGRVHVARTVGGYGLRIELTHAGGLVSLYGHLSATSVADGDTVVAGELIGAVGSTGNSTGPHLHFEVRRAGIAEDPRIDVHLP